MGKHGKVENVQRLETPPLPGPFNTTAVPWPREPTSARGMVDGHQAQNIGGIIGRVAAAGVPTAGGVHHPAVVLAFSVDGVAEKHQRFQGWAPQVDQEVPEDVDGLIAGPHAALETPPLGGRVLGTLPFEVVPGEDLVPVVIRESQLDQIIKMLSQSQILVRDRSE